MKNLSLFVTLSLLTIMGTCTIVKAEDNFNVVQSQDPNSLILSQETDEVTTDEETTDEVTTDEETTDEET